MKAKILSGINSLLSSLVAMLGFNSCIFIACDYGVVGPEPIVCEYGVPHAELVVSGNVTDESDKPVKNIRVQLHNDGYAVSDYSYTDEKGSYSLRDGITPWDAPDSLWVVATDTADVYEADSVRVPVVIDESKGDGDWLVGEAKAEANFQLKQKNKE